MDVIITSNSPGELSAWVAPVVERLRCEHPSWRLFLALVPCPFASGREYGFAERIEGLTAIWRPMQTLKLMLGGRLPIAKAERGLVLYLGGDPFHALLLGWRFGYPSVAYAPSQHVLWPRFHAVATREKRLAELLQGKGVRATCVGYLGRPIAHEALERREDEVWLGMFPGSRLLHLRFTLCSYLELARRIARTDTNVRFIMAVSPFVTRADVEDVLEHPFSCKAPMAKGKVRDDYLQIEDGPCIELIWGDSHRVIERLDVALCIPGTNTGEVAAHGKPLVVPLSANVPVPRGGLGWLAEHCPGLEYYKRWRRESFYRRHRFAALPNIWAGRMVVPEVLVEDDTQELIEELLKLLRSSQRRAEMVEQLAEVMGSPSQALERMVQLLGEMAAD